MAKTAARCTALIAGLFLCHAAAALERVGFSVVGDDTELREALRALSLVVGAFEDGRTDASDLYGAAIADYRTLVEGLYAHGHYGGVVEIRIDGKDAATIPLLQVPQTIEKVEISVDPGKVFRFGAFTLGPLPPGDADLALPATGDVARSGLIQNAVERGLEAWRTVGHAQAATAAQNVTANHASATLSVNIRLDPGPRVRFGKLVISGQSAVREAEIRRIAGFPSGDWYTPEALQQVATRLRRSGAFNSVVLSEAESLGPDDALDVVLSLADAKPRRIGFGAEVASLEGIRLSGFWLHRNFFGGAERLRVEAEVSGIGGTGGGTDYSLGARLESPAYFGADTPAFLHATAQHLDEPDFLSDQVSFGVGVERIFSDQLRADAGLTLSIADSDSDLGARTYRLISLPVSATYDRRDNALDPGTGTYFAAEVTPFVDLGSGINGVRGFVDARGYLRPADGPFVLAGRLQVGTVAGTAISNVHPEFLFYSGGGGTVRGQPYQSLDVDLGGGIRVGGRSFVGLSTEIRAAVSDRFGAVGFVDAGYVGTESLYDGSGNWHSGAGLGLRYQTPLGPIRFDVAAPVGGGTADGVQLYLGIGQAF